MGTEISGSPWDPKYHDERPPTEFLILKDRKRGHKREFLVCYGKDGNNEWRQTAAIPPEELEKYKTRRDKEKTDRERRALNAKMYEKANTVFYIERKREKEAQGKEI